MLATPLYLLGSFEVVILSFLLVPVKPFNAVGVSLCGMAKSGVGGIVTMTLAIFLLVFLGTSLLDLNSAPQMLSVEGLAHASQNSCTSEVVALVAGVDLLMGIVCVKLSTTMAALDKLTTSHAALKKQADNISKEYMRLTNEAAEAPKKDAAPKKAAKKAEAESEGSEDTAAIAKEIDELKAEKVKMEKELKTAKADSTSLKKQAEGLSKEYQRLADENEDLRDQLQDMDAKRENRAAKKGE